MSKSLRSMSPEERRKAIERRLSSNIKGLGWWAAYDAKHNQKKKPAKTERPPHLGESRNSGQS